MSERLKDTLHQWLPKLAILSVLVILSAYLLDVYYVRPRYDTVAKAIKEERDKSYRGPQAHKARAALERIVGLIDTLDGNTRTQEALSEAVAQEEAIGELWVTNAHGLIVYYGRHHPRIRNVADVPLGPLTEILDLVPEDVLSPIQQTAILLPAAMRDYQPSFYLLSDTLVEMARVKDGLIAIAVAPVRLPPGTKSIREQEERYLMGLDTLALVALIGLILFWLSIPAWMVLDAQKKRERAVTWGFFGLLGNLIALVVYLLVRENERTAPNDNSP